MSDELGSIHVYRHAPGSWSITKAAARTVITTHALIGEIPALVSSDGRFITLRARNGTVAYRIDRRDDEHERLYVTKVYDDLEPVEVPA